jgi:chaperonin GroES
MAVNITPLHDRVLVKRLDARETVKGGIIIPDIAKEKPQEGNVIAVGAGRYDNKGQRVPMDVKAGDHVLFGKYAGNEISVDDEEFFIIEEKDILAKIGSSAKAAGGKK